MLRTELWSSVSSTIPPNHSLITSPYPYYSYNPPLLSRLGLRKLHLFRQHRYKPSKFNMKEDKIQYDGGQEDMENYGPYLPERQCFTHFRVWLKFLASWETRISKIWHLLNVFLLFQSKPYNFLRIRVELSWIVKVYVPTSFYNTSDCSFYCYQVVISSKAPLEVSYNLTYRMKWKRGECKCFLRILETLEKPICILEYFLFYLWVFLFLLKHTLNDIFEAGIISRQL